MKPQDDVGTEQLRDANFLIGAGLGTAALGTGRALLVGAVCPRCIVAAPVLIGAGMVGRVRLSWGDNPTLERTEAGPDEGPAAKAVQTP